jgi:uncharacterized protein (TIGR03083 family)
MNNETFVRSQIEGEQAQFVELTQKLTQEQWATPSLCEGWSVRDVVVHTAWHIHLTADNIGTDDTDYLSGPSAFHRRQLARDGARSNDSLVEWLDVPAEYGLANFGELIVHQQDARRPLGLARTIPGDTLSLALKMSVHRRCDNAQVEDAIDGSVMSLGSSLGTRLRFSATDLDWAYGEGLELRGPGEAILMVLNGRRSAMGDLSGPGIDMLSQLLAAYEGVSLDEFVARREHRRIAPPG